MEAEAIAAGGVDRNATSTARDSSGRRTRLTSWAEKSLWRARVPDEHHLPHLLRTPRLAPRRFPPGRLDGDPDVVRRGLRSAQRPPARPIRDRASRHGGPGGNRSLTLP